MSDFVKALTTAGQLHSALEEENRILKANLSKIAGKLSKKLEFKPAVTKNVTHADIVKAWEHAKRLPEYDRIQEFDGFLRDNNLTKEFLVGS